MIHEVSREMLLVQSLEVGGSFESPVFSLELPIMEDRSHGAKTISRINSNLSTLRTINSDIGSILA